MESTYSALSTPPQIVAANMNAARGKTELPLLRMILLGIFAGMFIAGGASASSLAMHAISNVGLARLVAGAIFPVGLMMIVLVGGELFTGEVNTGALSADVENKSGITLPETGGMGTTLFYAFGSLLVLCAVVLLVTKRRMAF